MNLSLKSIYISQHRNAFNIIRSDEGNYYNLRFPQTSSGVISGDQAKCMGKLGGISHEK